jgi:hypothetical protein
MDTQDLMIVCMKEKGSIYECDTLRQRVAELEIKSELPMKYKRMQHNAKLQRQLATAEKECDELRQRVEELESSLFASERARKEDVMDAIRYNMGSMTGTIIVAP